MDNESPRIHALPRKTKIKIGLHLREIDPDLNGNGRDPAFDVLDVINGLHGVCMTLDDLVVNNATNCGPNHVCHLVMAAKVLSSIVQDHIEIPH